MIANDPTAVPPRRLKYIIVQTNGCGLMAILLHECITHSQAIDRSQIKALSAGFFSLTEDGVMVHKEGSVSLGLGPRPEDARIIECTLALMGLREIKPALAS